MRTGCQDSNIDMLQYGSAQKAPVCTGTTDAHMTTSGLYLIVKKKFKPDGNESDLV